MTVRVLFLAGMGRSGTTLVERVLAGVPGVSALGEVMHLWRRGVRDDELCGCGRPFSACEMWSAVGERAFGGWDRVDVDRVDRLRHSIDHVRHVPALMARRGAPEARRREYAGLYRAVYQAAREVTGSDVLVDSSKQASLPHVLARDPGIDLRVLHCVRDSRAVCEAWTKEVARPEAAGAAVMPQYRPRTMAAMWMTHNTATELVRRHGTPVMRLRYEDFLDDPRGSLSAVAAFAGVPVPEHWDHVGQDWVDLGEDHTAAGNPMRFTQGRVPLRRDEAWRTRMPVARRRLVTAMTAPLLVRYGYPLTGGAA